MLAFAALIALGASVVAQEARPKPQASQDQSSPAGVGVLALLPQDSVTEHTITLGGKTHAYTATAGTLDLYNQSGERSAAVFYTAYELNGVARERRPITFVFNGGPGAASAFLHLGLAGPRVIVFGQNGYSGADARLQDNPDTWLDVSDLVFIDPVGTGWSRTPKPDDAKSFYSSQRDAEMLAKTVALYLIRNGRTASPKYILGESYGGYRAIKIAEALKKDQGFIISGIVALSPLLEGALLFRASRFALGAALQFPSLAAAELERRGAFTEEALAAAERFAMTEYLTTLAGSPPEGEAARSFYARVAEMTGLPIDLVTRSRGFIRNAYIKNLRADVREIVSPYDVSFAVPDPYPESETARSDDPMLDGFVRALSGAFSGYAREQLGFRTDMTYVLLASEVSRNWDWQPDGSRATASVSNEIRELLALHADFRLFVAHGYSDLVTPYSVSRYVINHLPKIGEPGRVQLRSYRGGHMFYFVPSSRAAFKADIRDFYAAKSD